MHNEITQTVEKISRINLSGNITPHNWYKHITKITKAGKTVPDLLAISILADIVYWYRAKETRDENTGRVISLSKKFKSDKLQKSYSAYAEFFGVHKRKVKRSIDLLIDLKIITREFRKIHVPACLSNVVYIEPIPERIEEITYNENVNMCRGIDKFGNTTNVGYYQIWQEGAAKFGSTYTETTITETTVRKEKEYTAEGDSLQKGLELEDNSQKHSHQIEQASGLFPNTSEGIQTEKSFRQFFKTNYNSALFFLENMKLLRKEELYSFFNELQNYDAQTVLLVFSDITNRFDQGCLFEYRPDYVLNAIEMYLEARFERVKEVKDMVGIKVNPKLLNFCIQIFGNGQDALDVYHFYSRALLSKKDKQGKQHKSLVERQKKQIKSLVSDYGKDRFLKMVRQFNEGVDNGLLENPSLSHFYHYVNKWLKKKTAPSSNKTQSLNQKVSDGKVIPERYMRIGAENQENGEFPPEKEIYNWSYQCAGCGTIIHAWDQSCLACGSDFLWEHVDTTVPEDITQRGDVDDKRGFGM